MSTTAHKSAYQSASDDTLATMFIMPETIDRAVYEHQLRVGFFPDARQKILFEVLCQLRRSGETIIDATVLAKAENKFTQEWLVDLIGTYAPAMGAAFDANCRLVIGYGLRLEAYRIVTLAVEQLKNPEGKTTEEIIHQTMDSLGSTHTVGGIKGVTAEENAGEFETFMGLQPPVNLSTGIPWIQEQTGGFSRGDLWWVASAYKMRKTTLMLNLALQAATGGASVAFLSREMLKRQVAAQLVSMFAVGYLLEHDLYEAKNEYGHMLNWISARGLIQAQVGYRRWDRRKVAAIDYGIAELAKIKKQLRIYDTSPLGGRLSDIASLQSVVRRDIALYDTQIVFIDYLQLFDAPGASLFDKTMYGAHILQEQTKMYNLTTIAAAQKNEDAVKNGNQESYSPGVKGGGDVAATADYLLETRYKYGDMSDEKKLEVTMKLSRHGSGGGNVKHVFDIHPSSGLILESDYATGQRRKFTPQSQQSILEQRQFDRTEEGVRF